MTAGEFVYLIRADKSQLNKTLDESEKGVKDWGNKISSWTIAKGQMIGQFATKAIMKVTDITSSMVKNTINAYKTFEQLEGGAKLLFGSGYDYIMEKSKTAYKDVQMSANDYLNAVNGYAVGLKNSLGGDEKAAAELADRIITAQADVVAATGRSREAVQNAFAGLMRGNYMMIDNLGLGLKGSKEGMEEVIKTVNEWNATRNKATKYQMGNLADMQNALIDYIEKENLAGYAGKEAADTIEGTMASTKAAWNDLLVAFGSGKDVKTATRNLTNSAKNLLKNMLPVAKNTIQSIGNFVTEMIPEIGKWVSELATELKNSDNPIVQWIGTGIEKIQTMLDGASNLINHFPETVEALKSSDDPFAQLLGGALDTGYKALKWITENPGKVKTALQTMAGGFLAFKTAKGVSEVTNLVRSLRGVNAQSGGEAGSSWGGAFAAAVLKAAPWLLGLYALLKPAETAGNDLDMLYDPETGELTEAGEWAQAIEEKEKELKAKEAAKSYSGEGEPEGVWEAQLDTIGRMKNPIAWARLNKEQMDAVQGLWRSTVLGGGFFTDEAYDKFENAFKGQEELADRVSDLMDAYKQSFSTNTPWEEYPLKLPENIFKPEEPVEFEAEPKVDLNAIQTQLISRTFGVNVMPNLSLPWKSHAKGLWSVPYDNYPALLHRDEQVLTASQARHRNSGGDVDYEYVAQMIGDKINTVFDKLGVFLDGKKAGDMTSRRVGKNIRTQNYTALRARGG